MADNRDVQIHRLARSFQTFYQRVKDNGEPIEVSVCKSFRGVNGTLAKCAPGDLTITFNANARQRRAPRPNEDKRRNAAIYIQKRYRGFKARQETKALVRSRFCETFGENGERARTQDLVTVSSTYLTHLIFILRVVPCEKSKKNTSHRFHATDTDFQILYNACELFLSSVDETSRVWQVCTKRSPRSKDNDTVGFRIRRFVVICLRALPEVWLVRADSEDKRLLMLKTLSVLTGPSFIFGKQVQDYVIIDARLPVFRHILLEIEWKMKDEERCLLEELMFTLAICCFKIVVSKEAFQVKRCFLWQILSLPLLWKHFPSLTERVMTHSSFLCYFGHRRENFVGMVDSFLPRKDTQIPSLGCTLGNALFVAIKVIERKDMYHYSLVDRVVDLPFRSEIVRVLKYIDVIDKRNARLLEQGSRDGMASENRRVIKELKEQIFRFIFITTAVRLDMTKPGEEYGKSRLGEVFRVLFYLTAGRAREGLETEIWGAEVELEMERVIRSLWSFIKARRTHKTWPAIGISEEFAIQGSPNWMVPLSMFCILFERYMQEVDYHSFYVKQRVIALQDVKMLLKILKDKLWYFLEMYTPAIDSTCTWKLEIMNQISNVLRLLLDWNCRAKFTSPEDFHVKMNEAMAVVNPTLTNTTLEIAPFLIPFRVRAVLFRKMLEEEEKKRNAGIEEEDLEVTTVMVKRGDLFDNVVESLSRLPAEKLRVKVQVIFGNVLGWNETDDDGCSSFKKLVQEMIEGFDPIKGLFKVSNDWSLYPNPGPKQQGPHALKCYESLGKVFGKALLEGILIDLPFNKFFLKKLLQKPNNAHDLLYLDAELHNQLFSLKRENISELSLQFVASNESGKTVELVSGGENMQVTSENVTEYIFLMANYLLNIQIDKQCEAFMDGFAGVISPRCFSMFNEDEMQAIICGSAGTIDIEDLKVNTGYKGFAKYDPIKKLFWEVVKGFNSELRKSFLMFVTGVSKGPAFGFKYLRPQFTICRETGDDDEEAYYGDYSEYLTAASTPQNLLKLPPYQSKQILERKLLEAISA